MLTPHAGELARLLTGAPARRSSDPRWRPGRWPRPRRCRADRRDRAAQGATTLRRWPARTVGSERPRTAPAWLATAGSGDVLAGHAGTLLAAGLDAAGCRCAGRVVHGLAAPRPRRGPVPAEALLRALPATIARCSLSRADGPEPRAGRGPALTGLAGDEHDRPGPTAHRPVGERCRRCAEIDLDAIRANVAALRRARRAARR